MVCTHLCNMSSKACKKKKEKERLSDFHMMQFPLSSLWDLEAVSEMLFSYNFPSWKALFVSFLMKIPVCHMSWINVLIKSQSWRHSLSKWRKRRPTESVLCCNHKEATQSSSLSPVTKMSASQNNINVILDSPTSPSCRVSKLTWVLMNHFSFYPLSKILNI